MEFNDTSLEMILDMSNFDLLLGIILLHVVGVAARFSRRPVLLINTVRLKMQKKTESPPSFILSKRGKE